MRIFVLCFMIGCGSLHAQLPLIFHEKFDNNQNGWPVGEGPTYQSKIQDGKFVLITNAEDKGRFVTVTPFLDARKDFSLEATFIQKSGLVDNGIGLLWGREGNQYNAFQFSSNGYYRIYSPQLKGDINKWMPWPKVKPMSQPNRLRVEQKANVLHFYINDELVTTFPALPLYGMGVGFVNNTKMELEVDDFVFAHQVTIHLPSATSPTFKKENLGNAINTAADEVSPKISATGNALYFGRKQSEANQGGIEDEEDIWFSVFEDNQWTLSKNLGTPINSAYANNLIAISTDENTMIFTTRDGFGLRERIADGWTEVKDVGIRYRNEDEFIEGNLSSDGKAMLFTIRNSDNVYYDSNRIERDIFVSLKDKEGKWSEPINLGKDVNTAENEYSPFLAPDDKTLYFASKGWPGYGDADIFMTKRLDDTWTRWSEPINLGNQINSMDFDAYYTVPASGDFAYMSSTHQSIGKSDLFRVRVMNEVKPDPVVLLTGVTLNAQSNQPIGASIYFEDLITGKEVGEAISNPVTGAFRIVLPYGTNYGIRAESKGFFSISENFDLTDVKEYAEVKKDLVLAPIQVGEAIQLKNIFFEQGLAVLKDESKPELDRFIHFLVNNPSIRIELHGHTDNVGTKSVLLKLSKERMRAVKSYLVKNGVAPSRITGKGFGASQPMHINDTEQHRKLNRRVEFIILAK
ncbi:MAG: OmpA family protein [Cyclobacteriaceae bacterium]|nr:OmpA family protein [Cyclobacteriaceae bacterium]